MSRAKPKAERVQRCRLCSCTQQDCRQCIALDGHACTWAEEDLCSSCATANGAQLGWKERYRGIVVEGFDAAHDDAHEKGEILLAAISYAGAVAWPDENPENGKPRPCDDWPFSKKWWKPSAEPIRNLIIAQALIAAEIDRLRRLERTCWGVTPAGKRLLKRALRKERAS